MKKLTILVMGIFLFSFSAVSFATNHDTHDKKNHDVPVTKMMHFKRLEKIFMKSSMEELKTYKEVVMMYMDKMGKDHEKYYLLEIVHDHIKMAMEKMDAMKNIVDIVVGTEDVSVLKDVVIALDLVDTLSGEGPFTVFAPTNEAFADLLEELDVTFEELAQDTELLNSVVLYHVVPGKVYAKDVLALEDGTMVETVGGNSLTVSNTDGVFVDESQVIATDIKASNGVIHLIDKVLIPSE